eukprot:scaffold23288_cov171-Amphora_coffeaeformis.AAC.5
MVEAQDAFHFQPDPHDEQLLRVLAESSRGVSTTEDVLLQQVLAESRRHCAPGTQNDSAYDIPGGTFYYDTDIERAIALSNNVIYPTTHSAGFGSDGGNLSKITDNHQQSSFEGDLSIAMKLSLEYSKAPGSIPSSTKNTTGTTVEVLDLTQEVESPKRQKIYHLDEDDNNPEKPSSLDEKRRLAAEAASKRFSKHS